GDTAANNINTRIHRFISTTDNKVARITFQDLVAIGHVTDTHNEGETNVTHTLTPTPVIINTVFNLTSGTALCDTSCQIQHTREQKLNEAKKRLDEASSASHRASLNHVKPAGTKCDRNCRKKQLIKQGVIRPRGYAARVQVENMSLPESWTVTREHMDRLALRVQHVKETCRKYGLDKLTSTNQPNAWEFLINKQHGLAWCNVFKAASSTWIYNFNLLAGYTETELMQAKEAPINLARKRYPRPSVRELQELFNTTHPPLTFMIARHPLERLVSAYRNKILSGNRYYSRLYHTVLKSYPELGPGIQTNAYSSIGGGGAGGAGSKIKARTHPRTTVPSFPQFVQYLVDQHRQGVKLDEHWTPVNTFCTPCLVPYDVYAKVETLEEDGNYIIFTAGINDVIKPKRINRSQDQPTDQVADKFLCQLTKTQMEGLLQLYKYDIELFQYDVEKYVECTKNNT
ncbi:hypothetical protein Pmani_017258, partial [Petrolisthes manimaculis]